MSKTTIFQARLREFDSVDGGGLNLTVRSGRIRDDNTITDKADQTVALTDNNTNFVELNNLGVASANTSAFTSGSTPIAQVVTASGAITTITDKRAWVVGGLGASGAPTTAKYLVGDTSDVAGLSAEVQTKDVGIGQNLLKNGSFESWSAGTSTAPDKWTLSGPGASVAKDTTNKKHGLSSVSITRAAGDAGLVEDIDAPGGSADSIKGRTFTLSGWVRATAANRANITLSDNTGGTSSAFHTGSSTFEYITVTRTMDASATAMNVACNVKNAAATAQFDGLTLVEGSIPTAYNQHPNDEHLKVSNFQDTTPTNNTDQGVWRMEVGHSRHVFVAAAEADVTITFETAFRTVRGVWVTNLEINAQSMFGGLIGLGASGTTIRLMERDATNVTDTIDACWIAIGQV